MVFSLGEAAHPCDQGAPREGEATDSAPLSATRRAALAAKSPAAQAEFAVSGRRVAKRPAASCISSAAYCSRGHRLMDPPPSPSHDGRSARQKAGWARSKLPLRFARVRCEEKACGTLWRRATPAFPKELKRWNLFVSDGGGRRGGDPRSLRLNTHELPGFQASSYTYREPLRTLARFVHQ